MKQFWFGVIATFGTLFLVGSIWFFVGLFFFSDPDPQNYTKAKAAGYTMEKLVLYAEEHNVPVHEFKGPYFEESLGLDFPTYEVCYKHERFSFCRSDWTNHVFTHMIEPGDPLEGYSQANANRRALALLARYAEKHQVPLEEFKGPYFRDKKELGLEFPVYIVCYSHPKHGFCFDHWEGDAGAYTPKPGELPEHCWVQEGGFEGPD
ncbi:MAG: hypothetical protein SFZ03_11865 [Candidatus Melainabacteria bacterium]|nr:hypothetical protein [Candidatus Melainabacteria bacterium]